MVNKKSRNIARLKRHVRVRGKIVGTAERPRLSFQRSNQHIYLQIVDDVAHKSLFTKSDLKITKGTKTERAKEVGAEVAKELKAKKIKALVIDRGAYKYHGRIKAAVEVIREAGIEV